MKNEKTHPALFILFSLLFTYLGAALIFAIITWIAGKKKHGLIAGAGAFVLALIHIGVTVNVEMPWWGHTLILLTLDIIAAVIFIFLMMSLVKRENEQDEITGGFREVIFGMVGGGIIALAVGPALSSIHMLISDSLFSVYAPINFSLEDIMMTLFLNALAIGIAGSIVGIIYGRRGENISALQMILHIIYLGMASTLVLLTWMLFYYVPLFQLYQVIGSSLQLIAAATILFFLYIPLVVWIVIYFGRSQGLKSFAGRFALALSLLFLMGAGTSMFFGMIGYDCLLAGRYMERNAELKKAISFYRLGLLSHRNGSMDSYLQFNIALLERKLGDLNSAESAFGKVITRYYANQHLVQRARKFLDSLDEAASQSVERRVIPGVETRTEYKDAFCCPNTLALILRYWNDPITAREIGEETTPLGAGTNPLDAARFVRLRGKVFYTLPLAELQTIEQLIDLSFPVAVYIPGHIFAIFGYDKVLETYVTYDVADMDIWVDLPKEEFTRDWCEEFNTLSIVLPQNEHSRLPGALRGRLESASMAYLHYVAAATENPTSGRSIAEHFRIASELDPELFFIDVDRALTFPGERLPEKRIATIIEKSERFIERNPDNQDFLSRYVKFLIYAGKNTSALQFLEKKAEKEELPARLRRTLGLLYYQKKMYDKASSCLMPRLQDQGHQEGQDDEKSTNENDECITPEQLLALSRSLSKSSSKRAAFSQLMNLQVIAKGDRFARVGIRDTLELAGELKEFERAKKACEDYLAWNPYDVDIQIAYVRLQVKYPSGKKEERREEMRRAKISILTALALPLTKEEEKEARKLLNMLEAEREKRIRSR